MNVLKRAKSRSFSGPVQSVEDVAQTFLGPRLFQVAVAEATLASGMEIETKPRPEAIEEATRKGSEVGRLTSGTIIV
jgi:hypothetical protein